MNFALSTIIIILFLLPGAIFDLSYHSALRIKQSSINIPFQDLLLKGLFWSIVIHTSGICILHFLSTNIKFAELYTIIIGKESILNNSQLNKGIVRFFSYNLIIILLSWFIAKVIKHFVFKYKLDKTYYSLRLTNYWYEIFSGRNFENVIVEKIDWIFLDVLVKNNIVYSGILKDFNYSKYKDALENVILTSTARSILHECDDDNGSKHLKVGGRSIVPGDIFIIPGDQILNINVTYFKLSDDQSESSNSSDSNSKKSLP